MLEEVRTNDFMPAARLAADAARVLDVLQAEGIAIVPLDVAYAIVGMKTQGDSRNLRNQAAQLRQAQRDVR